MIKTADIKKGTRILLNNGWYATMLDSKKSITRFAEVEGFVTEMGSIYSFDIRAAKIDNQWVYVDYTEKELKVKEMNQAIFS
jgi:hypothetical protein